MKPERTLLLDGNEIAELLTLDESIVVVEQAFRLSAQGKVSLPDAAAAVAVYQKALKAARGLRVNLSPQGS
jgi:hypothetical protein